MTVVVLIVLWLIVVVPMLVRRSDERRRERSVDGFGRAMRALGRRSATVRPPSDVFVPRDERADAPVPPAAARRRPVPAAQEALMYPVDRSEMSEARRQMMVRRRRSLGLLGAGTVVFTLLALIMGGLLWLLAVLFIAGLACYLLFLRNQALRDRERRQSRQLRAAERHPHGYDATADLGRFEEVPESVVRIDDDDIELHNLDTIDLTGLYEQESAQPAAQRRAS
jgi:membrane protein implicated in regulation of membrane protease activity